MPMEPSHIMSSVGFIKEDIGKGNQILLYQIKHTTFTNCFVMLFYHPSAKGENWEALKMMNQLAKTYLKQNRNASPKAICKNLHNESFYNYL
jgi:hypothetical protein